jgi:hypothetical protein
MPKWTKEMADRESRPAPGGDRRETRKWAFVRAVEERAAEVGMNGWQAKEAGDEALRLAEKKWGR